MKKRWKKEREVRNEHLRGEKTEIDKGCQDGKRRGI
jgi:hypothetical protein